MKTRFAYELFVGIILVIAIIFFGGKGFAVFALLALQPFIGKKKTDERERQLFYRVGNYTAGATLLAATAIYYFSDVLVNGIPFGKYWLGLVVAAFLVSHGVSGLIIFKRN
jgi:hypothetical protein